MFILSLIGKGAVIGFIRCHSVDVRREVGSGKHTSKWVGAV